MVEQIDERGTPCAWSTKDQKAKDDPRASQSGSVRHRTKKQKKIWKKNTRTQFLVAFFLSRIFRTVRPDTQTICSRSKRSPESGLHRGGGQQNEMARNGDTNGVKWERVIYIYTYHKNRLLEASLCSKCFLVCIYILPRVFFFLLLFCFFCCGIWYAYGLNSLLILL